MLMTPSGIVMLVRPLQPKNALSSILMTLSGIVTLVRPLQPLKALTPNTAPILVTGFPS